MQIVEPDEVYVLAFAVPRDFKQIGDAEETGVARQLWRDLRTFDELHGVDFDLAIVHPVAAADLDVGTSPDPDAARNLSPTDTFAKAFCEHHVESLQQAGWRRRFGVSANQT
jgi:hypothetical protein